LLYSRRPTSETKSYDSALKEIARLDTVEDTHAALATLPALSLFYQSAAECKIHIFKEGIAPRWEDQSNCFFLCAFLTPDALKGIDTTFHHLTLALAGGGTPELADVNGFDIKINPDHGPVPARLSFWLRAPDSADRADWPDAATPSASFIDRTIDFSTSAYRPLLSYVRALFKSRIRLSLRAVRAAPDSSHSLSAPGSRSSSPVTAKGRSTAPASPSAFAAAFSRHSSFRRPEAGVGPAASVASAAPPAASPSRRPPGTWSRPGMAGNEAAKANMLAL
jgi:hypothetical protein